MTSRSFTNLANLPKLLGTTSVDSGSCGVSRESLEVKSRTESGLDAASPWSGRDTTFGYLTLKGTTSTTLVQ